jgi:L-lactate utilization protein LutB
MGENIVKWAYEQKCKKTVESLQKNGFEAVYCESKQEAYENIISAAQNASYVGFGGSMTVEELQVEPMPLPFLDK